MKRITSLVAAENGNDFSILSLTLSLSLTLFLSFSLWHTDALTFSLFQQTVLCSLILLAYTRTHAHAPTHTRTHTHTHTHTRNTFAHPPKFDSRVLIFSTFAKSRHVSSFREMKIGLISFLRFALQPSTRKKIPSLFYQLLLRKMRGKQVNMYQDGKLRS